ncbi:hypothetical protein U7230_07780 [Carboxydochorda subterranea]|uniref:PIN domain-containing protein n=1 Tax=Carboxydichorda subterranea TaxID=3109565 RepID=A0ABZ1BTP4_9FIRM|nr:hypothetical protein [Limnochorda sp. L945t]WRP16011.1 hypothetical protein U7230_07780 [Limnochorda sp. L945t]
MIVYIESNFVLELVFDQAQRAFAEHILGFVEQGGASLRLPAFTLLEPFYRVTSQVKRRSELRRLLEQERKHLARATDEGGRAAEASVAQAIRALDEANLTEYERLYITLDRTLACAQILTVTHSVYLRARRYQDEYDLEYPDAVIAASVIEDLEHHQDEAAFLCRDSALTDSMVRAEFDRRHCVLLTNFERAAHFVTGRKGLAGSA